MLHQNWRKTNRAGCRKRHAAKSEEGKEAEVVVVGDETRNRKTEDTGKTLSKKASRTCLVRTYGGQRVEIYRVVVALRSCISPAEATEPSIHSSGCGEFGR